MEDRDEWKLGDEDESGLCPRCGRRNHPGLGTCTICGTPLGGDLESDPGALRTIGETMGRRPPRPRGPDRHSLRAWTIAASLLVVVIAVLTWLETRETPFRLEDVLDAPEPSAVPAAAEPTAEATRSARATAPPARPTPRPPVATAIRTAPPPAPTVVPAPPAPVIVPPPVPTAPPPVPTVPPPVPTVPPPVPTAPPPAPTAPPPPIEPTPERERILLVPPPVATEKPSLGTDLQEATRAYGRAVDVHNAAVDEYNALADEIQRRDAWSDDPESVALRRRLDRAREAVEAARLEAEALRTTMEAVRSRYR